MTLAISKAHSSLSFRHLSLSFCFTLENMFSMGLNSGELLGVNSI